MLAGLMLLARCRLALAGLTVLADGGGVDAEATEESEGREDEREIDESPPGTEKSAATILLARD